MRNLTYLLIPWVALFLSSCAFDPSTNLDDKREADDNAYLAEKYSRITGRYHGVVTTTDGKQEADLTIYSISVPSGKNSRGETIFKPALRAHYRRTDTVTTDLILEARYFDSQIPPILSIGNFAGETGAPQGVSVSLTVEGTTLVGTVSTSAGLLGPATFELVDRTAVGPAQNDTNAENARREAIFAPVIGSYHGNVIPADQRETPPFSVSVRLFIDKRKDANGNYMSVLRARLHRNDTIGDGSDLFMDVDYSPDKTPPRITLSATGWVKDKPSTFPNYVFNGTIQNGVIQSNFTGNGYNGTAKLKRQ